MERSLVFEKQTEELSLSPQEVVLIDAYHNQTQDPWRVFRKDEPLAKVVPTRRYKVERSPHSVVLQVQEGIRVHVFYHLKGKHPDDQYIDENYYLDHVDHIAYRMALDLGYSKKQLPVLKKYLRKAELNNRLKEDNKVMIRQVREALKQVLLVGTTNLAVSSNKESYAPSVPSYQMDLFDEDLPPEMVEQCQQEFDDDMDDDVFPLFAAQRWKIQTVFWSPGTVADFLPDTISQRDQIIQTVDSTLERFFQERL